MSPTLTCPVCSVSLHQLNAPAKGVLIAYTAPASVNIEARQRHVKPRPLSLQLPTAPHPSLFFKKDCFPTRAGLRSEWFSMQGGLEWRRGGELLGKTAVLCRWRRERRSIPLTDPCSLGLLERRKKQSRWGILKEKPPFQNLTWGLGWRKRAACNDTERD